MVGDKNKTTNSVKIEAYLKPSWVLASTNIILRIIVSIQFQPEIWMPDIICLFETLVLQFTQSQLTPNCVTEQNKQTAE